MKLIKKLVIVSWFVQLFLIKSTFVFLKRFVDLISIMRKHNL